ncbi:hypothetical protein F441_14665, partial [Phytophthora nicotianae CJ01A1]
LLEFKKKFQTAHTSTGHKQQAVQCEADPMKLLVFSPSDDGEETDVLEYEHDASESENEHMLSATVSAEDLDDDYTTDSVEDMDVAPSFRRR